MSNINPTELGRRALAALERIETRLAKAASDIEQLDPQLKAHERARLKDEINLKAREDIDPAERDLHTIAETALAEIKKHPDDKIRQVELGRVAALRDRMRVLTGPPSSKGRNRIAAGLRSRAGLT